MTLSHPVNPTYTYRYVTRVCNDSLSFKIAGLRGSWGKMGQTRIFISKWQFSPQNHFLHEVHNVTEILFSTDNKG